MIDTSTWAAKWAERTGSQSAINAYKDGINRVTESPMAKAAQKQDKWLAGIQAAAESGKFRDNLNATPIELWKSNAVNVGAGRIASGVKKGTPKMQNFLASYGPFLQSAMQANATQADTTLEDRIAKSADMQRRLSQFKKPAGNRFS